MTTLVKNELTLSTVSFTQKLQTLEIALKAKDDGKIKAAFASLSKPERVELTDRVKLLQGRDVLDESQQRQVELLAVRAVLLALRKADSSSSSTSHRLAPFAAKPKAPKRVPFRFLSLPKVVQHLSGTYLHPKDAVHLTMACRQTHELPSIADRHINAHHLRPLLERYASLRPETDPVPATESEKLKALQHLREIAKKLCELEDIALSPTYANLAQIFQIAEAKNLIRMVSAMNRKIPFPDLISASLENLDMPVNPQGAIGKAEILRKWMQEHQGFLTAFNPAELDFNNQNLSLLPPEIGQLTALQNLWADSNCLVALPREIGQLAGLQQLSLCRNSLVELPREIGQLAALLGLFLGHNRLAFLPREIGQLAGLRSLFLNYNRLAFLPRGIGQLAGLRSLSLDNNRLVAMPREIGQLAALQGLNLDSNRLVFLPREIGQLVALRSFFLENNGLIDAPNEKIDLSKQSKTLQLENIVAQLKACLEGDGDPEKLSDLLDKIDQLIGKEVRSSLHQCLALVCNKAWKKGDPLRIKLKDPHFGRKAFLDPTIDPKLKLAAILQFSKMPKNFEPKPKT